MTADVLASLIVLVAFALILIVTFVTLYLTDEDRPVRRAALGEALHGREDGWGIHVAAEDHTEDEEDTAELPPLEEDPVAIRLGLVDDPGDVKLTALGYVRYADRTVHRVCLAARRDGREPCYFCAPVMAGVAP